MKFRDVLFIAIIAAVTVIISSALLADALKSIARKDEARAEVGRWSVYNHFDGGWNVFDSATGRLCSIPNGRNPNDTAVTCSSKP